MKIFFSEACLNYAQPGHPESPSRVREAYRYLRAKKYKFIQPHPCTKEDILLAHSKDLLTGIEKGSLCDADTPALPNMYHYAALAAGSAIEAGLWSLKGEKAFSLMRPPGHHATKNQLGGFCYFNNIAIAALRAQKHVGKIAIIDLDCHHGNGTEDIMLGKKDIIYVSLHQSPLYPGTGLRSQQNCHNYPLHERMAPKEYVSVLEEALTVVRQFDPDLMAISMGFDTYVYDPLTDFLLDKNSYRTIAAKLAAFDKPLFGVLEGGYHTGDMPECINQFLIGLSS